MENILNKHLKAYTGDSIYDFDNNILLNWYSKRIIELSKSNESLLELGLGHGFTALNFSDFFDNHLILDGSSEIINNFKFKYPNFKSNIFETFFETFQTKNKFDLIVMGFILEHVDNPIEIMRHYKQFMNQNGRMFLAVPNAEVMNRRLGEISGLLKDITELSENDILLGHKRYYTTKTFIKDINLAGLEVVNIEGIYLKPFITKQMISLNLDEKIIESLCKLGVDYPELSCGLLVEVK